MHLDQQFKSPTLFLHLEQEEVCQNETMETIQKSKSTPLHAKHTLKKWRKQLIAFWFSLIGTLTFFVLSLITDSYMLQPFYVSLAIVGTVLLTMNISIPEHKTKQHVSTPNNKTA